MLVERIATRDDQRGLVMSPGMGWSKKIANSFALRAIAAYASHRS
jgi:hypothetical protein